MNQTADKQPHLLIFHKPADEPACSAAKASEEFNQAMAWIDSLRERGISLGGRPLETRGRVLKANGEAPVDGPFAEGKEVIGGYLVILAKDLDEATAIAATCPSLSCNTTVEVRPIAKVPAEFERVLS